MKWSYDLCGAEPIIKDMPVLDAADIAYGELLMLSGGAFSAGVSGHQLVTAIIDTVGSTMAANAVGISLEAKDTDSTVSIATVLNTTVAAPTCFAKVIINPFAIYRANVSTAGALAVASSASTNEVCVTGIPASAHDGCWLAFTASAGPNYGQVRRIVTSATAGTQDLSHVANATITTADEVVIFSPKLTYANPLSGDALKITSTSVAGYSATNLRVVENYIGGEIMRERKHDAPGYSNGNGMKFIEQEIMMKDHLFGVKE